MEEYDDEDYEEEGEQKTNATMKTINREGQSIIDNTQTTFQGTKQMPLNYAIKVEGSKPLKQAKYNRIYDPANARPKPKKNDDYFRVIKKRKEGVPLEANLPNKIERHQFDVKLPLRPDDMNNTKESLTAYKEIIPSFLPNEEKYQKFHRILNEDEDEQKKRLESKVAYQQDGDYQPRRKKYQYNDPFEQHLQKIEDRLIKGRESQQNSPRHQQLNAQNRDKGFRSVQRNRDGSKLQAMDDNKGNISLPYLKDQINTLERKMESQLDQEAKLRKDAKRLIGHALGKQLPELDRTVKAWLRKDQTPAYINEMGPVYVQEYKKLIEKEIYSGKRSNLVDKFMRNGQLEKINQKGPNHLVALKDKLKVTICQSNFQQENEQRIIHQRQQVEGKKPEFNYQKIREVYNVSLLDQHFGSPEAYLLKKKQDAKATIAQVFKRKFEEKLIFQQMKDPKTLRKDRERLEQKLKMIAVATELSKQRLEWLIYDTPFTIQQLEEEVLNQRQGRPDEDEKQLRELALNFKIDKSLFEEMQKQSREARNILNIQMLEARALKNRTGCESISDFVLLYREFNHIERVQDMLVLLNEALLSKKRSQDFFDFIKKIVDFEDETARLKNEFADGKLDFDRLEHDQFYNYDEIALEKIKVEEKEEFVKQFKQQKVIFQFIPFWYQSFDAENNKLSQHLRAMVNFDLNTAKILRSFLSCSNMDEIVTYARHNRQVKEFILFEREELMYLIREQRLNEKVLRDFAACIGIISKEYMMVPANVFQLAKPSSIEEVNFSNFRASHLNQEAIMAIVSCIEFHQNKVKRLIFEDCELVPDTVKAFKFILSSQNIPIISCSFDNNNLGDQGIDHIVSALKLNPKGDMRILKIANNKLSIQAAIRISHVLKKRNVGAPLNLQILRLRNNQIGNIGMETLANFIKKNGTLKFLDALTENQKLKLIILKLGSLTCDKQAFKSFMNNGYMNSKKLRFLYLTTQHYGDQINEVISQTFLPKIYQATERYEEKADGNNLLEFLSSIVENQLFEGGNTEKVYQFGEKLLRSVILEKFSLNGIEILIYLFDNIFGPDYILKDSMTPFHLFAKHGLTDAIRYCLKLGISPNFKTSIAYQDYPSATALHLAAGYSQVDTCKQLINYGVEIDNKDLNGNTALHYAAVQGALQLAQLLEENGASMLIPNKKQMLPLHSCIFSDNLACFKFIVQTTDKQKAMNFPGKQIEKTIDIKSYQGFTPLMIALEEEAEAIFQYLLDNQADLKAQDEEGNTILHRAILNQDQKKAKLVLKRGASIDIRSFAGETPIMMAVRKGLIEVVRALVSNGADLFEKNYKGDSLLHLAARTDQADMIGYLLDKGLSTEDRNRDGSRAADLAKRQALRELLSHKNPKHDLYNDKSQPQKLGQRIKSSKEAATPEMQRSYYEQMKNNNKHKAHLFNEEYVKYQMDKTDVLGSQYAQNFAKYEAATLSNNRIQADPKDLKPNLKSGQLGIKSQQMQNTQSQYTQDSEEGEDFEDEDYEDEESKRQTQLSQLLKLKEKNPSLQRKIKESAGFRGTVDVNPKTETIPRKSALNSRQYNRINNTKSTLNDPYSQKGLYEDEEYDLDEDGEEYLDEEEEFEDEDEILSKTGGQQSQARRSKRNSKRNIANQIQK